MTEFAKLLIAALGGSGVAILAIVLVALRYPEKVQIWISWLWKGARFLTKRAEYAYIAQDVSAQLNANLTHDLGKQLDGLTVPRVAIRWDNDAGAVAREVEGTLIVRLRPHDDRTANLLRASLAATPQIILPTLRPQLTPVQSEGIDLQLCRRFAERLSASAVTRYRLDLLEPALERIPALQDMLARLQGIDSGGLFVPVFLQELTKVSAHSPIDRIPEIAPEIEEFLSFLVSVAGRERGENVQLTFRGRHIRVNIMLVARHQTKAMGVAPYRSRVTIEFAKGMETMYVMSTGHNIAFAEEVALALDADRRLIRQRTKRFQIVRGGTEVDAILIPFERNAGFATGEYFRDVINTTGLKPGLRVPSVVTDVQEGYVSLDVGGVPGIVRTPDLAWEWVTDCRALVEVGQEIEVEVQAINFDGLEVIAARRPCVPNPLTAHSDDELVGEQRTMVVSALHSGVGSRPDALVGTTEGDGLPIRLQADEYDWGIDHPDLATIPVGTRIPVVVTRVARDRGLLIASRKRLGSDKWPSVREKYPKGMALEATVTVVDDRGAFCELEPGISGFVPADEFRQAGFEYANYKTTLQPGHQLYVVVTRVVAGTRERVNLGLQVNRARR